MSTKGLGLVAALAFLSAVSLPRSSSAGEIYGNWYGAVTFQIVDYDVVPPSSSSGAYYGEMSLDYIDNPSEQELSISIGGYTISGNQFANPSLFFPNNPFGPNSAGGSMIGNLSNPSYAGFPTANFFVDYQSILPDGSIDTSYGSALGDIFLPAAHPGIIGETIFVSFQTVPEPSSIVLAGAALLMIGIFAWMRRSRPRPWSRLA